MHTVLGVLKVEDDILIVLFDVKYREHVPNITQTDELSFVIDDVLSIIAGNFHTK